MGGVDVYVCEITLVNTPPCPICQAPIETISYRCNQQPEEGCYADHPVLLFPCQHYLHPWNIGLCNLSNVKVRPYAHTS